MIFSPFVRTTGLNDLVDYLQLHFKGDEVVRFQPEFDTSDLFKLNSITKEEDPITEHYRFKRLF